VLDCGTELAEAVLLSYAAVEALVNEMIESLDALAQSSAHSLLAEGGWCADFRVGDDPVVPRGRSRRARST
jgi:hypothetical protein